MARVGGVSQRFQGLVHAIEEDRAVTRLPEQLATRTRRPPENVPVILGGMQALTQAPVRYPEFKGYLETVLQGGPMELVSNLQTAPGTGPLIQGILAAETTRNPFKKGAAVALTKSLETTLGVLRQQLLNQGAKDAKKMAEGHDWRITADALIADLGLDGRVTEAQRGQLAKAFSESATRKAEALAQIAASPMATLSDAVLAGVEESEEGMALLEQLRAELASLDG